MKKLFLSLLISGMIGGTVMAQQETLPAQKQESRAEWEKKIKDELKLTPDQLVKYDALSKEYGDKMDALQKDATLTQDAQKARKMELKKEKEAKLNEFLTPEQQTKYKEIMDRKKAAKPAGR